MHVPTNVEFDSFPLPSMLELNALTDMNGEKKNCHNLDQVLIIDPLHQTQSYRFHQPVEDNVNYVQF